ncbi:transcription factor [Hibiscus syriacus]|uniref:Transcription factor n=1 Tax=Hibiscus syriacus TaxID=106335 RepID=A0A6A2YYG9_HIBSY|nr:transcription factor [Hibiscus syriacus]
MLATWTPDKELNRIRLRCGADMKRKLRWYDLVALGVGGMLDVGVFVTTNPIARNNSGPSVFISYIIAVISALLSALCYTKFSVRIPVAGGAFSYLRVTFGEFVGYFAGANILIEYVLSNVVVARSFTEHLCSAFGVSDPNSWRVEVHGLLQGYNKLDFLVVAIVLILTLCLCHSTKESSILNLIMTIFHVVFFGFIIIMSFCNGSVNNLVKPKGLTPNGIRGVLDGAAIVDFSYIGYDSVSTLAEEIHNPPVTLPVGIIGSVLSSPDFTASCLGFVYDGTLQSGAGASLGIVTSLLVAMLGQARHPIECTLFLGICTAFIVLFTDLDIVIEMISIGTLLVFYLVANALIYRNMLLDIMETRAAMMGLPLFGGITIAVIAFFQYMMPCLGQPSE